MRRKLCSLDLTALKHRLEFRTRIGQIGDDAYQRLQSLENLLFRTRVTSAGIFFEPGIQNKRAHTREHGMFLKKKARLSKKKKKKKSKIPYKWNFNSERDGERVKKENYRTRFNIRGLFLVQ